MPSIGAENAAVGYCVLLAQTGVVFSTKVNIYTVAVPQAELVL